MQPLARRIFQDHLWLVGVALVLSACAKAPERASKAKLFLLAGQSNMVALDPETSFTPRIQRAFGAQNVVVVKDAQDGQSIQRWHRDWPAERGDREQAAGDLYERLLGKVLQAIRVQDIESVSLIWVQGEQDARLGHADVYRASLLGLLQQLQEDLAVERVQVVLGRLSDFDLQDRNFPHWTKMRALQVQLAEENEHIAWVDTDDLNDGLDASGDILQNDVHYSVLGYQILGERLAESAIALLQAESGESTHSAESMGE